MIIIHVKELNEQVKMSRVLKIKEKKKMSHEASDFVLIITQTQTHSAYKRHGIMCSKLLDDIDFILTNGIVF